MPRCRSIPAIGSVLDLVAFRHHCGPHKAQAPDRVAIRGLCVDRRLAQEPITIEFSDFGT
jgi:hypothetical protein